MAFMQEFHFRSKFSKNAGATFIILIPKLKRANCLKDFSPISLLGSMHKILAKVLAGRLCHVLPSIISHTQGAFIQGRQILYGVLIANKCIHSRWRDKKQGLLRKLDLEKES